MSSLIGERERQKHISRKPNSALCLNIIYSLLAESLRDLVEDDALVSYLRRRASSSGEGARCNRIQCDKANTLVFEFVCLPL